MAVPGSPVLGEPGKGGIAALFKRLRHQKRRADGAATSMSCSPSPTPRRRGNAASRLISHIKQRAPTFAHRGTPHPRRGVLRPPAPLELEGTESDSARSPLKSSQPPQPTSAGGTPANVLSCPKRVLELGDSPGSPKSSKSTPRPPVEPVNVSGTLPVEGMSVRVWGSDGNEGEEDSEEESGSSSSGEEEAAQSRQWLGRLLGASIAPASLSLASASAAGGVSLGTAHTVVGCSVASTVCSIPTEQPKKTKSEEEGGGQEVPPLVVCSKGGAEQPTSSSQAEPVWLHIYDVFGALEKVNNFMKPVGGGAFHAGVEVYGKEWSYGYADRGCDGVYWNQPRCNDRHRYRESVPMGGCSLTETEVLNLVLEMRSLWPGHHYEILTRNCCHFSDALCLRLGVGNAPEWLMTLAGAGAKLASGVEQAVVRTNEAASIAATKVCEVDEHYQLSERAEKFLSREIQLDEDYLGARANDLWANVSERLAPLAIAAEMFVDEAFKPIAEDKIERVEARARELWTRAPVLRSNSGLGDSYFFQRWWAKSQPVPKPPSFVRVASCHSMPRAFGAPRLVSPKATFMKPDSRRSSLSAEEAAAAVEAMALKPLPARGDNSTTKLPTVNESGAARDDCSCSQHSVPPERPASPPEPSAASFLEGAEVPLLERTHASREATMLTSREATTPPPKPARICERLSPCSALSGLSGASRPSHLAVSRQPNIREQSPVASEPFSPPEKPTLLDVASPPGKAAASPLGEALASKTRDASAGEGPAGQSLGQHVQPCEWNPTSPS